MSRRTQLEQLLQADPHDVFLHYALAMECVKEGDTDAGLERLRQIVQRNPDYVAAYFRQGQLLAERGELERARDVLQEGITAARRIGDTHAANEMGGLLETL